MSQVDLKKLYVKGANVWVINKKKQWDKGKIVRNCISTDRAIRVSLKDDDSQIVDYNDLVDLPPLCFPEDDLLCEKINLTNLIIVHEATITNVFKLRFERKCVYHYCGIGMVFVNPYVKQPVSNHDKIMSYRGKPIGQVKPHVFAVAENAYQRLERENRDQSIIFTGESGTGKSENAKQAILYLVNISAKDNQMKEKILASTTVLEAFGNAKVKKNENSSRFLNSIDLHYDSDYHIIGASLKCYIIKKSTIILEDNTTERNFNIFYQLRSTKTETPCEKLKEEVFDYLDRRESYSPSPDDVNDPKSFDKTSNALKVLGFSPTEQNDILRILLAIANLGNLKFRCEDRIPNIKKACAISNLEHLDVVIEALDITLKDKSLAEKWFCQRRLPNNSYNFMYPMTVEQAIKARNDLAAYIYVKLFNWMVTRMNACFRSPCKAQSFVSILDFPGTDTDSNSFEQFCINQFNEQIQRLYNHTIFKLEQNEYFKNDIGWNFFSHKDNIEQLDRLETNEIIGRNLKQLQTKKEGLVEPVSEKDPHPFRTQHFVNVIEYDLNNFTEKNNCRILSEHIDMLTNTNNQVLRKIITEDCFNLFQQKQKIRMPNNELPVSFKRTKKMVIQEVQAFLNALRLSTLKTFPHYVRCIKSNDEKAPLKFDSYYVSQQVKDLGLKQLIKISALGYFSQRFYEDFVKRYHCLCRFKGDDLKEASRRIILNCFEDNDHIRFGTTKVYIREEDVQHLEKLRTEKRLLASILIQKTVRCFLAQKRIERSARRYLAPEHRTPYCQSRTSAAVVLQKIGRGFLARRRFTRTMRNIVKVQACVRRFLAKRATERLMRRLNRSIDLLKGNGGYEVDVLQAKIQHLVNDTLHSKELEPLHQILNERNCIHAKNKILNTIIFQKINKIKELSKKKEKDLKLQKVAHETQDCGEHHKSTDADKLLEDNNPSHSSFSNEEEFCNDYQNVYASNHKFDKRVTTFNEILDSQDGEMTRLKADTKQLNENLEQRHLEEEHNNNPDGNFEIKHL